MALRRKILQLKLSLLLGAALAASPFSANISKNAFKVAPQAALAKSGTNGNGGGNGNGGSKSETRGNSNSRGSRDKSVTTKGGTASLSVRHDDGMSEVVRNGRYIMKDSKGRTIVNRKATLGDEIRLRFFSQ